MCVLKPGDDWGRGLGREIFGRWGGVRERFNFQLRGAVSRATRAREQR
jgi:hypothetical protein